MAKTKTQRKYGDKIHLDAKAAGLEEVANAGTPKVDMFVLPVYDSSGNLDRKQSVVYAGAMFDSTTHQVAKYVHFRQLLDKDEKVRILDIYEKQKFEEAKERRPQAQRLM